MEFLYIYILIIITWASVNNYTIIILFLKLRNINHSAQDLINVIVIINTKTKVAGA